MKRQEPGDMPRQNRDIQEDSLSRPRENPLDREDASGREVQGVERESVPAEEDLPERESRSGQEDVSERGNRSEEAI